MSGSNRLSNGISVPVSIRLESEIHDFYRREAKKNGVTLSEYLRRKLAEGVISQRIDERMSEFENSFDVAVDHKINLLEKRLLDVIKQSSPIGLSRRVVYSLAIIESMMISEFLMRHGDKGKDIIAPVREKAQSLIDQFIRQIDESENNNG